MFLPNATFQATVQVDQESLAEYLIAWFDADIIQTAVIFPGGRATTLADIIQFLVFAHPTCMKRASFNDDGALVVTIDPTISQVQSYLDSTGVKA